MARRKAGRDRRDEADAELYLGDVGDFVARRNELAKGLRAEGDAEAAGRVRALKKPSRTAWAINQFSAGQAKLRDELLDAGAALRKAHEQLMAGKAQGADLRRAGEREQAAVGLSLEAVNAIANEAGGKLSPAALDRARQTLHAVALDENVRDEFVRHRLTTEHEPAGLGGIAAGAGSAKASESKDSKRRRDELKAGEAELRKLEQRQRAAEDDAMAARKDAEQAQRNLDRAAKALAKATDAAAAASEKVETLRGG